MPSFDPGQVSHDIMGCCGVEVIFSIPCMLWPLILATRHNFSSFICYTPNAIKHPYILSARSCVPHVWLCPLTSHSMRPFLFYLPLTIALHNASISRYWGIQALRRDMIVTDRADYGSSCNYRLHRWDWPLRSLDESRVDPINHSIYLLFPWPRLDMVLGFTAFPLTLRLSRSELLFLFVLLYEFRYEI
jgi:hypothetical protein